MNNIPYGSAIIENSHINEHCEIIENNTLIVGNIDNTIGNFNSSDPATVTTTNYCEVSLFLNYF